MIDAEAIMARHEAAERERAERMPTERDAIRVMFEAWQRLKALGWRDGRYMPTTGERHAGIACGSTGIHAYSAEQQEPRGTMYTIYDGDIWPTRVPPVLFRPWRDTDVQVHLRPACPMPEDAEPAASPGNSLAEGCGPNDPNPAVGSLSLSGGESQPSASETKD